MSVPICPQAVSPKILSRFSSIVHTFPTHKSDLLLHQGSGWTIRSHQWVTKSINLSLPRKQL